MGKTKLQWDEVRKRMLHQWHELANRVDKKEPTDKVDNALSLDDVGLHMYSIGTVKPTETSERTQHLCEMVAKRMADRCDEREVKILGMRYIEGYRWQEIAMELDLSVQMCIKISNEALEKLRKD